MPSSRRNSGRRFRPGSRPYGSRPGGGRGGGTFPSTKPVPISAGPRSSSTRWRAAAKSRCARSRRPSPCPPSGRRASSLGRRVARDLARAQRFPPFDRYAVIPVAPNVWQHLEGRSPATEARRLIGPDLVPAQHSTPTPPSATPVIAVNVDPTIRPKRICPQPSTPRGSPTPAPRKAARGLRRLPRRGRARSCRPPRAGPPPRAPPRGHRRSTAVAAGHPARPLTSSAPR